jgi:hypothetical protein
MASHRQLETNRANAKRSTGPKSADGKARSSKNALAHGLTARDIVIGDEDPEEFERLRMGLQADFKPASMIERELVERLAGLLWRLRRIPVLEGALLDARQEETASGAQDFTLPVTVEQREVLIAAWYEMQEPEYQQFLTKFYQGPYASRGAEDTIEEVDETGSKPASSRVKECDHLDKTKASHDSVGNASAEAAKNSERYPKKKGCVFGLMTPTENREEAFAPDWH